MHDHSAVKSVSTQHNAYAATTHQWQRARDCLAGEDAIRAAGETYEPRLSEETDAAYNARLARSSFFNGAARVLETLTGTVCRKPPEVNYGGLSDVLTKNIDRKFNSVEQFSFAALEEFLSVSRVGLLVEYSQEQNGVVTKAAAASAGLRANIALYKAESIINWRLADDNPDTPFALVVLAESKSVPHAEGFGSDNITLYRVLDIDGGLYRVRIYQIIDGKDVLLDTIDPKIDGKRLNYIPFKVVGGPEPGRPALDDLYNLNITLWQQVTDHHNILHLVANPTFWVTGYKHPPGDGAMQMGSGHMMDFESPDVKLGILELQGHGLAPYETRIESLKSEMAIVGSRTLEPRRNAVESSAAADIHRAGELSVLATAATEVSETIEWCLKLVAVWSGGSDADITFRFNTDYDPHQLDAALLQQLTASWAAGAMPTRVVAHQIKEGELAPAGMSVEDIEAAIDSSDGLGFGGNDE